MPLVRVPVEYHKINDWDLAHMLRTRIKNPEYWASSKPNDLNIWIEPPENMKKMGNQQLGRLLREMITNRLESVTKRPR